MTGGPSPSSHSFAETCRSSSFQRSSVLYPLVFQLRLGILGAAFINRYLGIKVGLTRLEETNDEADHLRLPRSLRPSRLLLMLLADAGWSTLDEIRDEFLQRIEDLQINCSSMASYVSRAFSRSVWKPFLTVAPGLIPQ